MARDIQRDLASGGGDKYNHGRIHQELGENQGTYKLGSRTFTLRDFQGYEMVQASSGTTHNLSKDTHTDGIYAKTVGYQHGLYVTQKTRRMATKQTATHKFIASGL